MSNWEDEATGLEWAKRRAVEDTVDKLARFYLIFRDAQGPSDKMARSPLYLTLLELWDTAIDTYAEENAKEKYEQS